MKDTNKNSNRLSHLIWSFIKWIFRGRLAIVSTKLFLLLFLFNWALFYWQGAAALSTPADEKIQLWQVLKQLSQMVYGILIWVVEHFPFQLLTAPILGTDISPLYIPAFVFAISFTQKIAKKIMQLPFRLFDIAVNKLGEKVIELVLQLSTLLVQLLKKILQSLFRKLKRIDWLYQLENIWDWIKNLYR